MFPGADSVDVCIIGGGVVGCGTARALLLREASLRVCLLEKESGVAQHQSGRNSGVVHAGYNQKPGTMKAKFVVEGSRRLRQYCRERDVALVEDGILVLARTAAEEETLETLRQRGEANGAEVRIIGRQEIADREPEAKAAAALFAPQGASFDSRSYVASLAEEAVARGVQFVFSRQVESVEETGSGVVVRSRNAEIHARLLVNAAGLHTDRIAAQLGVGGNLRIVPFLGCYSELRPDRRGLVRSHLYPCPDLEFPFLGVHLSRTFDGRVLVGPGSSLALGREAYTPRQARVQDILDVLGYPGFRRLFAKPRFRQLVRQEWRKSVSRSAVAQEAQRLAPALRVEDLVPSRAGIRAQLVSKEGDLVDDLVIKQTDRSVHILNAVSPALTCSLPFADHIAGIAMDML